MAGGDGSGAGVCSPQVKREELKGCGRRAEKCRSEKGPEPDCSPLLSRRPEAGRTAARRQNPADLKRNETRLAVPRSPAKSRPGCAAQEPGRSGRLPWAKKHSLAARPPNRVRWGFFRLSNSMTYRPAPARRVLLPLWSLQNVT